MKPHAIKTGAGLTVAITDYTSTLPRDEAPVLNDFRQTPTGPVAKLNNVWYSVNGSPERGWIETRYPLDRDELRILNIEPVNEPTAVETIEIMDTNTYKRARIDVGRGHLVLKAYPCNGVTGALHWSLERPQGEVVLLPHLEKRPHETWAEWFEFLDRDWPNHNLRWAFALLAEHFPA